MQRSILVSKLRLKGFRNFANLELAFTNKKLVFYGQNGSGKTNILEAISLISPGRGIRRATYKQMCNIGEQSPFTINLDLHNSYYGNVNIGISLTPNLTRRILHINQDLQNNDLLLEYSNCLWLSPLMDRLFIGGASDRCRFLDRLVLSIESQHGINVRNYEKAMKQRNHLLAIGDNFSGSIVSYEQIIAKLGILIAQSRLKLIEKLQATIIEQSKIASDVKPRIAIDGVIEQILLNQGWQEATEFFLKKLYEGRMLDAQAGRSLFGTHRSDFLVYHQAKDVAANMCSTGEQKLLLVSILLAQAKLSSEISQTSPILLLDELGAHFDQNVRAAILEELDNYPSQVIMTGSDRNLFEASKDAQFIALAEQ